MIEVTALFVGSSAGLATVVVGIALYVNGMAYRLTRIQKLHDSLKARCATLRNEIEIAEELEKEVEKARCLTIEAEKKLEEAETKLADSLAQTRRRKKWVLVRYIAELNPDQPLAVIHEQAEVTIRTLWDEDAAAGSPFRSIRLIARHGEIPKNAEKHDLLFEGKSPEEWQAYRKHCDGYTYVRYDHIDEHDDFYRHALFHFI